MSDHQKVPEGFPGRCKGDSTYTAARGKPIKDPDEVARCLEGLAGVHPKKHHKAKANAMVRVTQNRPLEPKPSPSVIQDVMNPSSAYQLTSHVSVNSGITKPASAYHDNMALQNANMQQSKSVSVVRNFVPGHPAPTHLRAPSPGFYKHTMSTQYANAQPSNSHVQQQNWYAGPPNLSNSFNFNTPPQPTPVPAPPPNQLRQPLPNFQPSTTKYNAEYGYSTGGAPNHRTLPTNAGYSKLPMTPPRPIASPQQSVDELRQTIKQWEKELWRKPT